MAAIRCVSPRERRIECAQLAGGGGHGDVVGEAAAHEQGHPGMVVLGQRDVDGGRGSNVHGAIVDVRHDAHDLRAILIATQAEADAAVVVHGRSDETDEEWERYIDV
jgi:hypothetical protein